MHLKSICRSVYFLVNKTVSHINLSDFEVMPKPISKLIRDSHDTSDTKQIAYKGDIEMCKLKCNSSQMRWKQNKIKWKLTECKMQWNLFAVQRTLRTSHFLKLSAVGKFLNSCSWWSLSRVAACRRRRSTSGWRGSFASVKGLLGNTFNGVRVN